MIQPRIVRVHGALAEARPASEAGLYELAWVGERRLLGEVIRVTGETATLQVYEETAGLALGEPVEPTHQPLTLELGPGLLGSVLDGAGRPLEGVAARAGSYIAPGIQVPTLDPARTWSFEAHAESGTVVSQGDVLGTVNEPSGFCHRVLVPPGRGGRVATLRSGTFTVWQEIGRLDDGTLLTLAQRWPVRVPRPVVERQPGQRPFLTGQRVFDLLFPVVEGGTVAVPGGFGTGKTVIEQSLAKFAEADVVVYVGCGERGNEMAEVLDEFPRLQDPRSGRPVMDRTVLVVNTSNMPVAAREGSVYVGMTLAEYFRDMGLRVAIMADSLSRWAEALREIGSRLQEMPGEEGYPTYLGNRLAKLYERAGRARVLGRPERDGAVTFISAISPPGGDFSEPVTQASLRVTGTLWALDASLAHQRQFPAVSWESSYTAHASVATRWFDREIDPTWSGLRLVMLGLLQRERELRDVAELVGPEALEARDRLVLEVARIVRETVIGQSAYEPGDAYSPPEKTWQLARLADALLRAAQASLDRGTPWEHLDIPRARRALAALRTAGPTEFQERVEAAANAIRDAVPQGSAP
ncbi:MAG TPA: V-type ATP synthase subunit A [Gemmatimonadales bacterium]